MPGSGSAFRWPTASRSSTPRFSLRQHQSTLNLHEEPTWQWPRSPPSPSPSSSSSASSTATITLTSEEATAPMTSPSRSSTPKNPWSVYDAKDFLIFSQGSPQPRTPSSTSRCLTPVAATQPVRPQLATSSSAPVVSTSDFEPSPPILDPRDDITSPTPGPSNGAPHSGAMSPLTSLTLQMFKDSPNKFVNMRWDRSATERAYGWAIANQKTALLFYLCDDLAAWRKASFFGLQDRSLPYTERDLEGIAQDPRRIVELQWKVMIKDLPRSKQHVDFTVRDFVPLQHVEPIDMADSQTKGLDKVRWLDDLDGRVYARKWFVYSSVQERANILRQLQNFKTLEHLNIAQITVSYSQKSMVGIVMPLAHSTLESHLRFPSSQIRIEQLLTWMQDLAHGLAYIHSHEMVHKDVRPGKILIDGSRIFFSVFGILGNGGSQSPRSNELKSSATERYIFTAPETITRRKTSRSSDVFALGCVFACMMTVIKGQTLHDFQNYRMSGNQDPSFHGNMEYVFAWIKHLRTLNASTAMQRREKALLVENRMLSLVESMINPDPPKRIKIRRLITELASWSELRTVSRRRSLDASDLGRWNDLISLGAYYNHAGRGAEVS